MKNVLSIVLLFLFLILCSLLGGNMLLHKDFFFLSDQARDMLLVRDMVLMHKLSLIGSHSGLGGLFHGPLWLYLLVPVFLLGAGDPLTFAHWYLVMPLLTIVAAYFVGLRLYNRTFGLVFAFLLSINPIMWGYVPNTIGINLMPLLMLFLLFFAIKYIRGDEKAFPLVTFFAGLAFQFETASAIALIPVVILLFFFPRFRKLNFKIILLSIASYGLSLATFILFDLRHKFLIFTSVFQLFNQHQGHQDYANFAQRFFDHAQSMLSTYQATLFTSNMAVNISLFLLLGYAVFLFIKNKDKQKTVFHEFIFSICTPAIVYIFYLLYAHPIYKEYILDLILILVFGLTQLLLFIWEKKNGKVLVSIFLLINLVLAGIFIKNIYTAAYVQDGTAGSYQNQRVVADWILQDANKKPFGYFVYTPETFTYGMDYLFWWGAKNRNLPQPESKKLPITYLIMYPPLANDTNAHNFWKKNVIHTDGKVLETKIFRGNIVVAKLSIAPTEPAADPNYYQNLLFR